VNQSSEFCRHNPFCCFSPSNAKGKRVFRYQMSPENFGYTLVIGTDVGSLKCLAECDTNMAKIYCSLKTSAILCKNLLLLLKNKQGPLGVGNIDGERKMKFLLCHMTPEIWKSRGNISISALPTKCISRHD
jgi:hypothetical protein